MKGRIGEEGKWGRGKGRAIRISKARKVMSNE